MRACGTSLLYSVTLHRATLIGLMLRAAVTTLLLAVFAAACAPGSGSPPAVPEPTPGFGGRIIYLDVPASGAQVGSEVEVRGRVTVSPFEASLRGRVYDASGRVAGEGPVMVQAEMGKPGPFAGRIRVNGPVTPGTGRVEVAELSMRDGSVMVSASVNVRLGGT